MAAGVQQLRIDGGVHRTLMQLALSLACGTLTARVNQVGTMIHLHLQCKYIYTQEANTI